MADPIRIDSATIAAGKIRFTLSQGERTWIDECAWPPKADLITAIQARLGTTRAELLSLVVAANGGTAILTGKEIVNDVTNLSAMLAIREVQT